MTIGKNVSRECLDICTLKIAFVYLEKEYEHLVPTIH